MAIDLPEVIPRTRTITLAGQQAGRETFAVEMNQQSLADIRAYIRAQITQTTAEQINLGNPPALVEIDTRTNKDLADVEKRAVVVYGVTLATAAMRQVEMELTAAIDASTRMHSGRLRAVSGGTSWRWLFVPKGGAARPVSSGEPVVTFKSGDVLCLMPVGVPYATLANRNVARSGRLTVVRKGKPPPKSLQDLGFLATAARAARKKPVFKQFAITAQFTKAHMVPGELMTQRSGTGYLSIRPRFRRVKL